MIISVTRRPRPTDARRAWLGDVAALLFWPAACLAVVVALAVGTVLLLGLAT